MNIFNLVPAWKINSIRAHQRTPRVCFPVAEAAIHPLAELPFLCRRVLRIVAENPRICHADLYLQADLGACPRPQADELILYGLIERQGQRYTLTTAGLRCLQHSPAPGDNTIASRAQALLTTTTE